MSDCSPCLLRLFLIVHVDHSLRMMFRGSLAVSCWPVPERPSGQQPSLAYIKFRFVRCLPQGWRTPYCLSTLSGLDMRFRQAILATIACLLLPFSFAELITSTSYFSRQRACAFLLELLGEENTCALLARAPRWPLLFRVRMGNAARALRPRPGGRSQSID